MQLFRQLAPLLPPCHSRQQDITQYMKQFTKHVHTFLHIETEYVQCMCTNVHTNTLSILNDKIYNYYHQKIDDDTALLCNHAWISLEISQLIVM